MKKVIKWLFTPVDGLEINWVVNGFAILFIIALLIGVVTNG